MLCDKCGAENLDNGRFCTMCGLPFNGSAEVAREINQTEKKHAFSKMIRKKPVVIAIAAVAAAVIVIVLFAVIIPQFSVKNRINHVWYHKDDKMELTLDFPANSGTLENKLKFPIEIEWEVNSDRLSITMLYRGQPLGEAEEYIVSFGSGGEVMTWTEVGAPSSVKEFTRMD